MDKNIEQSAAEALLDRGVAFRIPAPLLWRLFGRKTMLISVKRLRIGTFLYTSAFNDLNAFERITIIDDFRKSLIGEMGFESIAISMQYMRENAEPITKSIAACLLNSPIKIRLFVPVLARILRRRCTWDQLQELTMWIMVYSRMESFTNTTKFLSRMMLTKPMNCSES